MLLAFGVLSSAQASGEQVPVDTLADLKAPQSVPLLVPAEMMAEPPTFAAQGASMMVRQRFARLDKKAVESARRTVDEPVALQPAFPLALFDDIQLHAMFHETAPTSSGYSLAGRIEGSAMGSVTLVVNRDAVAGTVRTGIGTFVISGGLSGVVIQEVRSEARGLHRMEDDPHPTDSTPLTRGSKPADADKGDTRNVFGRLASSDGVEDGSRIDVMVVYTPAAREEAGGVDAIEAAIDLRIAEINQAFSNSGVVPRVHLSLAAEVDYTEVPGRETVNHLRDPSDGYMDEVHLLRDQYAADLVHLIVDQRLDWCGEAKRLRSLTPEAAAKNAFSASRIVDCYSLAFAHELGHSMGLAHDRYAEIHGNNTRLNRVRPYSHGYVNQRAFERDAPASSRWRTIMAYDQQCRDAGLPRTPQDTLGDRCFRPLRYSNPYLTHNGDPTGVPGDEPSAAEDGPADARRSLNETSSFVANFRVAPCLRDGWRTNLQASNGQFLAAEIGGRGAILANRDKLLAGEDFVIVDHDGACVESGDAVSLRTSNGFYVRAALGGGAALDAKGTSAGDWGTFTVHRRAGGGKLRSGDFIALEGPDGHYVVAEQGGGGTVSVTGTQLTAAWENFKLVVEPQPDGSTSVEGAPLPVDRLADAVMQVGDIVERDVAAAFRDPDDDVLTFEATSSAPDVVSVAVHGSTLTVKAMVAGTTTVSVTATGGDSAASAMLTFRVQVTSAHRLPGSSLGDLNGDGRDDVLLRHRDGRWHFYPMDGQNPKRAGRGAAMLERDTQWRLAGVGDFDGDDREDVLLRHDAGRWLGYLMDGRTVLSSGSVPLPTDLAWTMVGLGDLDGDGRDDVLLRHKDGRWRLAPLEGLSLSPSGLLDVNLTKNRKWPIAGIGDMNGDGHDDVLLRHENGHWHYYPMRGSRVGPGRGRVKMTTNPAWSLAGLGDMDGDGSDDALLRHENGRWYHYPLSGKTILSGRGEVALASDPQWKLAGMGDLNGDGRADILLRHNDGRWHYYGMWGRQIMEEGSSPLTRNPAWTGAFPDDRDVPRTFGDG